MNPEELLKSPLVAQTFFDLTSRWQRYDLYDDYLKGRHRLSFATEKFRNAFGNLFRELAVNYCRRVIGGLSDRMMLDCIEKGGKDDEQFKEWARLNRLDSIQGDVHKDAFAFGDGYIIVNEAKDGTQRMYRQNPRCCRVMYDPELPQRVLFAVKLWRQIDGFWRLNVYTPDGTARFISTSRELRREVSQEDRDKNPMQNAPTQIKGFKPMQGEAWIANPVPLVPVFHFAHEPSIDGMGNSELETLIPLQDGMNKTLCDLLVGMEFQAFRQRWATGIEVQYDEKGQPIAPFINDSNRFWYSGNPDVNFGDFGTADLKQILEVLSSFRVDICCLSHIPPHYLFLTSGQFPTGEALKTAEQPLVDRLSKIQMRWGDLWEAITSYALDGSPDALPDYEAKWKEVTPRSRKEESAADYQEAQTAEIKHGLDVPLEQLQRELGYTDEQIKEFAEKIKDEKQDALDRQQSEMMVMQKFAPKNGASKPYGG